MLSEFFIKLLSFSFGKKRFQAFYKKLYSLSLRGMNYGLVGSGEENAIEIVKKTLKKDSNLTLFDVGANVGTYTDILLKHFPSESHIYSFEPSKSTYLKLQQNHTQSGVFLQNLGLGNKNEQIELYKDKPNSTLASAFKRTVENQTFEENEKIEVQTLDHFCKKNNIEKIDFLKLDVEGFELNVFKGAKQLLEEKKISIIQFEFGGTQIPPRVFLKDFYDLLSPNYTLSRILKDGLEPIEAYNERLENFSYSNYLAILKNEV